MKTERENMTDSQKLRVLAAWLDIQDDAAGIPDNFHARSVQVDLRRIAAYIALHEELVPK